MKIDLNKSTNNMVNEVEKQFDKCIEVLNTSKEVVKILDLKLSYKRGNRGMIDYNYLTDDYPIRSAENRRVETYTPDGKDRDPLLVNVWKEIEGLFMEFKNIVGIEAEIFDNGFKRGRYMLIEMDDIIGTKVYEYRISMMC